MFLNFAISQILSYDPLSWVVFIAIAFSTARYLPCWCIPAGHIVTALVIAGLDLAWIHAEMSRPGWDGIPDQDIVFFFGVFFRVLLINTVLLPLSGIGVWRRWVCRRETARPA
jgi:hypothetical protein